MAEGISTVDLSSDEMRRVELLYSLMDADSGGSVDLTELKECMSGVLEEGEYKSMMSLLDTDGDQECSMEEWTAYLVAKKAEKGQKRFGHFLRFLEVALGE